MGALNELALKYRERARFLLVYVREAHPSDGWAMGVNQKQGIVIPQPKTLHDREEVAGHACSVLSLAFPTLVDGMDNSAEKAYQAWPDRLYVVGSDGRIQYAGDRGPFGFKASELGLFLDRLFK